MFGHRNKKSHFTHTSAYFVFVSLDICFWDRSHGALCEQGLQTCTSVAHPGRAVSDSEQIHFLLSLDSQYTSQKVLLASEACFSQRPQLPPGLSINAPGIPECFVLASDIPFGKPCLLSVISARPMAPKLVSAQALIVMLHIEKALLKHQQGDRRGQCFEPASHFRVFLLNLFHSSSAPVCSCDSAHPSIAGRPPNVTLTYCLSLHHHRDHREDSQCPG